METTRTLELKYLIFNADTLKEFFDLLSTYYDKSGSRSGLYRLKVRRKSSMIETNAPPENWPALLESSIEEISLYLSMLDYPKQSVAIYLNHGTRISSSYVRISGEDEDWINSVAVKVEDYIKRVQPQRKPFAIAVGCISISIFLCFSLGDFMVDLMKKGSPQPESSQYTTLKLVWTLFTTPMISSILFKWVVEEAFPAIEIQTGPAHFQTPKKNRNRLFTIATLLVIPLIINFVHDILKQN